MRDLTDDDLQEMYERARRLRAGLFNALWVLVLYAAGGLFYFAMTAPR